MRRCAIASSLLTSALLLSACTTKDTDKPDAAACRNAPDASPYEAERAALVCRGSDAATAAFVARATIDVREAYADGVGKERGFERAHVLALDRQTKIAAFRTDAAWRAAWSAGDDDHDLVPNARDRCPGTPAHSPTDAEGCGYDCERLEEGPSRLVTVEQCRLVLPPRDGRQHSDPLAIEVPINPYCFGTPAPSTSVPLAWTPVVLDSGLVSSNGVIERTYAVHGLRFFVVRSDETAAKCELFYEFDVHAAGGAKSANFMFSTKEDTAGGNPDIAAFEIRTARTETERALQPIGPISLSASYAALPLSPGRSKARDVFVDGAEVSWRVRAIDGLGKTGGWSEFRTQKAGADPTH